MNDPGLKRRVAIAGFGGALLAVLVIGIHSRGHLDRMTFGDGRLHRAVAANLAADASSVPVAVARSGPALRYGRIGFPSVLWVASGGRESAMAYVQPILMVLCSAGIGMTTAALLRAPSLWFALAPFVAPGLTASLAGGFAEPLALLLSLLAVLFIERSHRWWAAASLAGALLARENAVVIVVGVVAWLILKPRLRDGAAIASSVLPAAVWHLIVDNRFGQLPLRDPWLVDTGALGVPFVAVAKAIGDVTVSGVVVIAVHLLLAVAALLLWRSSLLGAVAAVCALPILFMGGFAWRYIGDGVRLAVFVEVFVIIALCRAYLESPRGARRPPKRPRRRCRTGRPPAFSGAVGLQQ